MPHIHTKPGQHDHTVSGYIIRTDFNEPKLMLHAHKKRGRLMQFGGHVELDENPWQALKHELLEETGYAMPELVLLQPEPRLGSITGAVLHPVAIYHITHSFGDTHFHSDLGYAFTTGAPPKAPVGENESQDIITVSRSELVALPEDDIFESVREAGLFVFDVCLKQWQAVNPDNFA